MYIVPAEFGVHFLPRVKNVQKQTKLHLNEIGLTNNEFCKKNKFDGGSLQSLRKGVTFRNTGVRVNVTTKL